MTRYDIMVSGDWDDRAAETFADVQVTRAGVATILSADLDQAALHGLLQRVRWCGLTLLDVRRKRARQGISPHQGEPPGLRSTHHDP